MERLLDQQVAGFMGQTLNAQQQPEDPPGTALAPTQLLVFGQHQSEPRLASNTRTLLDNVERPLQPDCWVLTESIGVSRGFVHARSSAQRRNISQSEMHTLLVGRGADEQDPAQTTGSVSRRYLGEVKSISKGNFIRMSKSMKR